MSKRQNIEAGLMITGAMLSTTGAVFVAPVVIGAGVVAVGAAALMRYKDQKLADQA